MSRKRIKVDMSAVVKQQYEKNTMRMETNEDENNSGNAETS